jgi:hypothetical protein
MVMVIAKLLLAKSSAAGLASCQGKLAEIERDSGALQKTVQKIVQAWPVIGKVAML